MIDRTYLHVHGPPGGGKTTFVRRLIASTAPESTGADLLVVRATIDDALPDVVESAVANEELLAYALPDDSGAVSYTFPQHLQSSDAFFETHFMENLWEKIIIEGDLPLSGADTSVFVAPPPEGDLIRRTMVDQEEAFALRLAALDSAVANPEVLDALIERMLGIPTSMLPRGDARARFRDGMAEQAEVMRRIGPPPPVPRWTLAPGYESLAVADVVLVNARTSRERGHAEDVLDEIARLRREAQLFDQILLPVHGTRRPITARAGDLRDPDDDGVRSVLTRVRRGLGVRAAPVRRTRRKKPRDGDAPPRSGRTASGARASSERARKAFTKLPKFAFATRFRRQAFGWRSALPIKRIKEAVAELKKLARTDPVAAAEGSIIFLGKLVPAIEHVDGSSGAIGTAVYRAVETLVPIIGGAEVPVDVRSAWMVRLWSALVEDGSGYLDELGDHWGTLCGSPTVASRWADELVPTFEQARAGGGDYFVGSSAALSSLLAAERYTELLEVLERARTTFWPWRRFGVRALVALGRIDEAIAYAEVSETPPQRSPAIALECEKILLDADRRDEAYAQYAIAAHSHHVRLTTMRRLMSQYPERDPRAILEDLVTSTPGDEGQWFAAAKHIEHFERAAELARQSPCNPRTLHRGARDHVDAHPEFALDVALTAIDWIEKGHGYEITVGDVWALAAVAREAGKRMGRDEEVEARIREIAQRSATEGSGFVSRTLRSDVDRGPGVGTGAP